MIAVGGDQWPAPGELTGEPSRVVRDLNQPGEARRGSWVYLKGAVKGVSRWFPLALAKITPGTGDVPLL
jgi:hypothetical protein